jgi:(S)-sulfolactate dehydrogenase
MPDIVITEFVDEAALADLAKDYEVLYDPELCGRKDELARHLAEASALIVRNRTQVTDALLATGPNLKVVGRLGVGLDNIDLGACEQRGVAVRPATGANTVAVAEYVIAVMLILLRGATYRCNAEMVAGDWPRLTLRGREAAGKRLGLVGLGAIARAVAQRASTLEMKISAYDPYLPAEDEAWNAVEHTPLPKLLSCSDIITLHVPLTDETRHVVNVGTIKTMKQDAIIINAARGGVIDEDAIIAALKRERLGGAALDVFENEPLDAPGGGRFADVPNLILTPHVAGLSDEANVRTGEITVANVRHVLEGRS